MTTEELTNLIIARNYIRSYLNANLDYIGFEKAYNRIPHDVKPSFAHLQIENSINQAKNINEEIVKKLNNELETIDKKIDENTKLFFDDGYIPLRQQEPNGVNRPYYSQRLIDQYEHLKIEMEDEIAEVISTIIGKYSEWKFPSLEIGCGKGEMTRSMVSADPLYVTDIHDELLIKLKENFNEIYKKRIRCYLNRGDPTEFNFLPQGQFQFILAWNVFNTYPINPLSKMLISCWNLMRPGATIMFTYNDCDYIQCLNKFTIGYTAWHTEKLITKLVSDTGFDIVNIHHYTDEIHWIEAKKPGELVSVKVHPAVGTISVG